MFDNFTQVIALVVLVAILAFLIVEFIRRARQDGFEQGLAAVDKIIEAINENTPVLNLVEELGKSVPASTVDNILEVLNDAKVFGNPVVSDLAQDLASTVKKVTDGQPN